jgi:hypothetical protein
LAERSTGKLLEIGGKEDCPHVSPQTVPIHQSHVVPLDFVTGLVPKTKQTNNSTGNLPGVNEMLRISSNFGSPIVDSASQLLAIGKI